MKRVLAAWLLLAIALVTLAPAAASAAETTAAPVKAPSVTPSLVDVQLWAEDTGNRTSVIVVGVIPTSTPLPAAIALPVPKGAAVTWAGEIFADANQDLSTKPTFAADHLSLVITATKSHTVQYEAQYDPWVDKGGRRYVKLAWVQTTPAAKQRFSVKLPLVSDDIKLTPAATGDPFVNSAGEKLYTLPGQTLKTRGTYTVAADYVPRLPQTPAPKSASDYIIPVTLGLLAIAVVALLVLVARSSRKSAEDGGSNDE